MNLSFHLPRSNNFLLLIFLALGLTTLSVFIRYSSHQASMALFSYENQWYSHRQDTLKEPFVLYPGPNPKALIVKKKEAGFIHLTDPKGITQRQYWIQEGYNRIDLSQVPPGVYMCWAVEWNHRKVEKVIVF